MLLLIYVNMSACTWPSLGAILKFHKKCPPPGTCLCLQLWAPPTPLSQCYRSGGCQCTTCSCSSPARTLCSPWRESRRTCVLHVHKWDREGPLTASLKQHEFGRQRPFHTAWTTKTFLMQHSSIPSSDMLVGEGRGLKRNPGKVERAMPSKGKNIKTAPRSRLSSAQGWAEPGDPVSFSFPGRDVSWHSKGKLERKLWEVVCVCV